jgi:hypothetical protein
VSSVNDSAAHVGGLRILATVFRRERFAELASQLQESHKATAGAEGRAAAAEARMADLKQQVADSQAQVCA